MAKLSQNKKISIAVLIVFLLSFTSMIFFLDAKSSKSGSYSHTSILDLTSHNGENADPLNLESIRKNYLDGQNSPTFLINSEGMMEYMNEAFYEMLSMELEDLDGNLFYNYVNAKDLPEMVSITTKLFQDGESMEGGGPYRLGNGSEEVLVILDANPVFDDENKVTHVLFTANDITEQVEEMHEDEVENEWQDEHPIRKFYPKIRDLEDEDIERLMVDKITYRDE